jgi:hypothetical protein
MKRAEMLTITRARSNVQHAEAVFAQGQPIRDAFGPFSAGGATDRQEAYTALLLVIAEYFARAGRLVGIERERYER